jgi:RNA polymerase sigma factor (sigma-70 family)
MSHRSFGLVLQQLRRAVRTPGDEPGDGELLRRFAVDRDETAFETLLQRHGPMVWALCHRMLPAADGAEDAFQASFLVLVRKAGTITRLDSAGSWLYGVAYRTALDARARAQRRRFHESKAANMQTRETCADGPTGEARPAIDEELQHLPEKYRLPIVLCYLEGKTNDEAAQQLGWTRGTVAGRLSRARDLLRDRLGRRGLALSGAALATALSESAASALPAPLMNSTLAAALRYAAGTAASSPAPAVTLAEGVMRAMETSRVKLAATLLLAVALVGTGVGVLLRQAPANPAIAAPAPNAAPVRVPAPVDAAKTKADRPAVVKGNTEFALDLYGRLRTADGNLFYSPYSISTALAMTYAGARADTAEQMAKALHFTLEQDRLHPGFAALHKELNGDGPKRGYQLSGANTLWGHKDIDFRNEFLATIQANYDGGLHLVDFIGAREEARRTMNAWVEKQTREKIKDLIKESHLTLWTRLVLTNAIYFKGDWARQFPKGATREGPFQVTTDKQVKVPLMHQTARFKHLDNGTFQILELPYQGNDLSMIVLLPKKVDGLADLEKSLTPATLAECLPKLREEEVIVTLPKFKVTAELDLKEQLSALGMPLAFDRDKADFTGMAENPDGNLYIFKVVHKAFVDVDEEGTEAAAATAVVINIYKSARQEAVFRADHPFLFLIRDNRSGSVLFLGRLVNPA